MIYTIALILLLLWLLGMLSSVTVGGLIHALIVVAVVLVLFRVINNEGGN